MESHGISKAQNNTKPCLPKSVSIVKRVLFLIKCSWYWNIYLFAAHALAGILYHTNYTVMVVVNTAWSRVIFMLEFINYLLALHL